MSSKLLRITLNSNQPDILVQFYAILGFVFVKRNVDKGSSTWVGTLPNMEIEIFGIRETFTHTSPSVQLSFEVQDVSQVVQKVKTLGTQIMMEPLETKSGLMSYLVDPDGRSIELLQPSQNLL